MTKLIKAAEKAGCQAIRTKSGHWKIKTPSGATVVAAFSPTKPGSVNITKTRLKRAGVNI